MASPRFGRVELRIMQVLWEKGRVSARQITETINQETPMAHSTVQTMLRELERKGAVDHDVEHRTFLFFPLVKAQKAVESASREIIDRMLAGSPVDLVCHLLKHEHIDISELKRIQQLIDDKEKKR